VRKTKQRSLTALTVCLCLLSLLPYAEAGSWPTHRADNRRSGATAETVALPLSLQWTFKPIRAPRPAWPEPAEELPRAHCDNANYVAVAGGVAYFGSSVDDKVYAIDVAEGKIRWSFYTEGPVRFAPAVYKGRVYLGSDDGYVYCLSAGDGKLVWKHRPGPGGDKVIGNGRMISAWPVRTSVLVDDGQVLATAGVFPFEGISICALDAEKGSVIWKNDTVGARSHELNFGGISPHGYLVASKSMLYVPSGRAMPAAFDRKTGRLHFYATPPGKRGGAWALLDDGRLIAGVDASGAATKKSYDAQTGEFQGDAFTWVPGGIDMVTAADFTHIVTPDGIQAIDRKLYDSNRKAIADAETELRETVCRLSAAVQARGYPRNIPMPDVHLSELEAAKATSGWGQPAKNKSIYGQVLTVGGKQYEKGMGVHSVSELVYPLKGEYKALVAVVGVDDEVGYLGTVVFQVFIDGKEVYETPRMRGGGGAWHVYVPIPAGSREIRLVATDGGDGASMDHADWANAGFVTKSQSLLPAAESRPALDANIEALRRQCDLVAKKLQEAKSVVSVRRYPRKDLESIIRAGNVVFAGGKGFVVAIDARTDKELWTAEVEGRAVGLAVSDACLFVSTDKGLIYCFGKEAPAAARVIAAELKKDPFPADGSAGAFESAAELVVQGTGITKGYCLVRDFGTGRLAFELAKRTELKIIGFERDPEKLAAARRNVEAAGLLGSRIVVEPWDPADLPDYFANLILSDEMLFTAKQQDFDQQWARLLRPFGGTAVFCRREGNQVALEKIVRGGLEGAGGWRGQYADAQNTACSEDKLVKGPLGVLWYGEPGPKRMVDRHDRGASPVSMDGRLFIQGKEVIMAYDAYNGTRLWQRDIPGAVRIRADVDGGNLALTGDALYVAARDKCHRLDPATGEIVRTYTMPASPDGTPRRWGYVAVEGKMLLGTTAVTMRKGVDFPAWVKQVTPEGSLTKSLMGGDALFALDAETGQPLWVYRGQDIANISIAVADGVVYLADRATGDKQHAEAQKEKQQLIEKGIYEDITGAAVSPPDVRLIVALKAASGEVLWKKPVDVTGCGGDKMGSACKDGVVLLFGHFSNHDTGAFLNNQLGWRRIIALNGRDGSVMWSRPLNYLRRPVIVGDTIIIEPRACELRTGKIKTREHPVSGSPVPWEFLRPGHSCGITSASADTLFYRSFSTAMYELNGDKGLDIFGAIRPGCWLNNVPANGLMLMPEASSGCTCSYPIRCSVALVHKPMRIAHDGTVFITHGPMTPVKRLAVNLGATGDVRDSDGTMWFAYPRPQAVSGVGYGRYGVDLNMDCRIADGMGFFRRDFRAVKVEGSDKPWLFASGCKGLLRCEMLLIDDSLGEKPGRYSVRLGFAPMPGDKPGRRVFDVGIQGRTVLKGFDIAKEAPSAGAVVKRFDGIDVQNYLTLELVPSRNDPTEAEAPVINFIEVVREDAVPEDAQPPAPIAADRAAELLAEAEAELKNKNADKALELYETVFEAAQSIDARLLALDRMKALGRPESLAAIRKCWDAAVYPILCHYKPTDQRIVNGMVALRLAVADKLAAKDKALAARAIAGGEGILPRLADQELKRQMLKRLGYIIDWRLVGPIPWNRDQASIAQVLETGRPVKPDKPYKAGDLALEWTNAVGVDKYTFLQAVLGPNEYALAYAYAEITLDEPRDLLLNIEADDAYRCWFNGTPAGGSRNVVEGTRSRDVLEVKGRKGVNTILLQVVNLRRMWLFSARVTDKQGVPAAW